MFINFIILLATKLDSNSFCNFNSHLNNIQTILSSDHNINKSNEDLVQNYKHDLQKVHKDYETLKDKICDQTFLNSDFNLLFNELKTYILKNNSLNKQEIKLYFDNIVKIPQPIVIFRRCRYYIKIRCDVFISIVENHIPFFLKKIEILSLPKSKKKYLIRRLIYIQMGFTYIQKFFKNERVHKEDYNNLIKLYIQFYFEIDQFLKKFVFLKIFIEFYDEMICYYRNNKMAGVSIFKKLLELKVCINKVYDKNYLLKRKILLCIIYMKNKK